MDPSGNSHELQMEASRWQGKGSSWTDTELSIWTTLPTFSAPWDTGTVKAAVHAEVCAGGHSRSSKGAVSLRCCRCPGQEATHGSPRVPSPKVLPLSWAVQPQRYRESRAQNTCDPLLVTHGLAGEMSTFRGTSVYQYSVGTEG